MRGNTTTNSETVNIAVNTRFLLPGSLEGFGVYTHEIMSRITATHPEDQFSFYFDRSFDERFIYNSNVTGKALFPPARHPLLFRVWYDWSLQRELRRTRPDVLFSPDSFLPARCVVPGVITVHDVAHRRYPEQVPGHILRYFEQYMPVYIERADKIITVSEFSREEICTWYPKTDPDKIEVIYNGVSGKYRPIDADVKREARDKWTTGRPYLLYVGAIHPRKNLARLIRAYDIFRDSTPHDLPLLLAGRKSWQFEDVEKAKQDSPYSNDILFTGYIPEEDLPRLIGAADVFCYMSLYEGFGLPVIEAMASGVPVLCSSTGAIAEVAADSAVLADPLDPGAIAANLQRILDDSVLRKDLIARGITRASGFTWEEAADRTYGVLSTL